MKVMERVGTQLNPIHLERFAPQRKHLSQQILPLHQPRLFKLNQLLLFIVVMTSNKTLP